MSAEKLGCIANNCATAKMRNVINDTEKSDFFFNSITLNVTVDF